MPTSNLPLELLHQILVQVPVEAIDWDEARQQDLALHVSLPTAPTWARLILAQQTPNMFAFLKQQNIIWNMTTVTNVMCREQYFIERNLAAINARLRLKTTPWPVSQQLLRRGITLLTYIKLKAEALGPRSLQAKCFVLRLISCLSVQTLIALRYVSLILCYACSTANDTWLPKPIKSDYLKIANFAGFPSSSNAGHVVLAMESTLLIDIGIDELPGIMEKGLRHHHIVEYFDFELAFLQELSHSALVETLERPAPVDYSQMGTDERNFEASIAIERRITHWHLPDSIKRQIEIVGETQCKGGKATMATLAYLGPEECFLYLAKETPASLAMTIRSTAEAFVPDGQYVPDFHDVQFEGATQRALEALAVGDKSVWKFGTTWDYVKKLIREGRLVLSADNMPRHP